MYAIHFCNFFTIHSLTTAIVPELVISPIPFPFPFPTREEARNTFDETPIRPIQVPPAQPSYYAITKTDREKL
jgi:hypothetical protein